MAQSLCKRKHSLFLPKSQWENLSHRSHQSRLNLCRGSVGAEQPRFRSSCRQIRPRMLWVRRRKAEVQNLFCGHATCHSHEHRTGLLRLTEGWELGDSAPGVRVWHSVRQQSGCWTAASFNASTPLCHKVAGQNISTPSNLLDQMLPELQLCLFSSPFSPLLDPAMKSPEGHDITGLAQK